MHIQIGKELCLLTEYYNKGFPLNHHQKVKKLKRKLKYGLYFLSFLKGVENTNKISILKSTFQNTKVKDTNNFSLR